MENEQETQMAINVGNAQEKHNNSLHPTIAPVTQLAGATCAPFRLRRMRLQVNQTLGRF